MSLDRIFGLYTLGFLLVTVLIGIAELAFGLPSKWIGWIFMALSLGIYVFIGIITRTSNADQYYVAGRGVPAIYKQHLANLRRKDLLPQLRTDLSICRLGRLFCLELCGFCL
jgi:hypothetical protein